MKKLLIIPLLLFSLAGLAQPRWKQNLRYDFHVVFDSAQKSLQAIMKLDYTNNSPDTLGFIWFQLWPNAYRNDRTLYTEQQLENGDLRFYFSSREQKGYLNRLEFRVNGVLSTTTDHPEFLDVVKLNLPQPLPPGRSINISTSFHLKLPFDFDGFGYGQKQMELRNWYPEPAVYDEKGWHPMPFLLQGGAYHEPSDFSMDLQIPSSYKVAAGAIPDTAKNTSSQNTLHVSLRQANSLAWVAGRFEIAAATMEIGSGKSIAVRLFHRKNFTGSAALLNMVKQELVQLSAWLGPYPWESLTLVESTPMPNQEFSGLISFQPSVKTWASDLRRAIAAQWFETRMNTDQRNEPWFSKGFTEYYERRFSLGADFQERGHSLYMKNNLWLRNAYQNKTAQPIPTPAPEFSVANDSLIAGQAASLFLVSMRDSLGEKRFDDRMREYFSVWQSGHPYPDDFFALMSSGSSQLSPFIAAMQNGSSFLPPPGEKVLKPVFLFSAANSAKYNYIGLSPLPGYNRYDGFMLGGLIHNFSVPENRFQFLLAPLYGFQSRRLGGLGRISYSWMPGTGIGKITAGINGSTFSSNHATDSLGKNIFETWAKVVPYLRIDLRPSSARSSIRQWLDFKFYGISETSFEDFAVSSTDSLIHPNALSTRYRYVNQLSYNLRDDRALYPYGFRVELQQSELFYRINLHADYFLNYPGGGGLTTRFFAALFGVWHPDDADRVFRYQPKLLGVNGDEDYLYEDYFIGRSASYALENASVPNGGFPAQQIMNRDGGLKLRSDAFDYVQGRSGSWVTAMNFNTTLPNGLFPFPLPVRLFFDFGTYAEAWENNPPTSRFLYTGGVQLCLFHNVLNVYAPLFYSSDFNDAMRGLDFWKKITFSIDIGNIPYKKMIRKAAMYE